MKSINKNNKINSLPNKIRFMLNLSKTKVLDNYVLKQFNIKYIFPQISGNTG